MVVVEVRGGLGCLLSQRRRFHPSNSIDRHNDECDSLGTNTIGCSNLEQATCTNTCHTLHPPLDPRRNPKRSQPFIARGALGNSGPIHNPHEKNQRTRLAFQGHVTPSTVGFLGWCLVHHLSRHPVGCMPRTPSSHVFRHELVVGGVAWCFDTPSIATSARLGLHLWTNVETNRTSIDVATIAYPTTNRTCVRRGNRRRCRNGPRHVECQLQKQSTTCGRTWKLVDLLLDNQRARCQAKRE